ncbi:S41 family peptidase [Mycoplasma phocoenae]|uniref:Tail specific protease domain-containing protein n=1 Tax=Mycoplasma phocoenae TaxID=754517 RepID=A0A858U6F3_9MOLU|nr:S41 family peptidase [Mycoplasma phocoenae]QJG67037.1 hypothetical protein HGG69_01745 [Mycoplasma phocoenae]
MKKILWPILSVTTLAISSSAISCNYTKDIEELHEGKEFDLIQLSDQYKINAKKLTLYSEKNSDIKYVDLQEWIHKLNGFLKSDSFKCIKKNKGVYEFESEKLSVIFNAQQNKISYIDSNVFKFTEDVINTDFDKYIKYDNENIKTKKNYTIDLNEYNYNIYDNNNSIFIPFSIFNLLFVSQNYCNFYFNGSEIVFNYFVIDKDTDTKNYDKTKGKSKKNKTPTINERLETYNFLCLLFDNFYGIKSKFLKSNNSKNFNDFFTKTFLKEKIISTDIYQNAEAYQKFIYSFINEMHTMIASSSYYDSERFDPYSIGDSSRLKKFYVKQQEIKKIRSSKIDSESTFFKIYKDTAFIYLNSFEVGTTEQLKRKDSWKFDSYELMDKAFKEIKNNKNVKNIMLDLSLNSGGTIAGMEKVLGFLTNKNITFRIFETGIDKLFEYDFKIDTNKDFVYDEKDGYSKFNWYVLSDLSTYSAANLFVNVVKQNKLATVLGNKTGGGMFSVLPVVLPDGTSLTMSSNLSWTAADNNAIDSLDDVSWIEDGIEPDVNVNYMAYMNYDVMRQYMINKNAGDKAFNNYLIEISKKTYTNILANVELYLNNIKQSQQFDSFNKTLQENKITDLDTLEMIQNKITNLKKLFELVEFEYKKITL